MPEVLLPALSHGGPGYVTLQICDGKGLTWMHAPECVCSRCQGRPPDDDEDALYIPCTAGCLVDDTAQSLVFPHLPKGALNGSA